VSPVSSIPATPLVLGAPGIYPMPDTPIHTLTGARMDVCAFVGVAPRGPARSPLFTERWAQRAPCDGPRDRLAIPVAVESWSAYTSQFGGFEGPGLLPYAVAAFFDNGGRRAYIVRIVHRYVQPDGSDDPVANAGRVALSAFAGISGDGGRPVVVRARSEGLWGNRLEATLSFVSRALALDPSNVLPDRIHVPPGTAIIPGVTLRLFLGVGAKVIRRIRSIVDEWNPLDGTRRRVAFFDAPAASAALAVEVVEGFLAINDGVSPVETHEHLGLSSSHPRWLAKVLAEESSLLYPADDPNPLANWLESDLDVDSDLEPVVTAPFSGGDDRYADIVSDDFFDPGWVVGDECPGCGVHSLVDLEDLSLVVVPDLYSPAPLPSLESIVSPGTFAGPEFRECVPAPTPGSQATPASALTGLLLDPAQDLDVIAGLQRRLTDLADDLESFIVLLDVPPGLSQRRMRYWRAKFDTAYAAAYHPWLQVARADDAREKAFSVNPSGFAAGIIAQREAELGVPYGPANVIAAGVVTVDDRVPPARHDELHQMAINVYLQERDGVRLTAARTLSLDSIWRQLSVRRLVTMIRRAIDQQMQWAVFEPNSSRLREQISNALDAFLRQLFHLNAFTGATEEEAFFVKCDDVLNPPQYEQVGQLLAQIGVAPAEPLEFIVLDVARDGDSVVIVEAR
jgi:uncharacterized protein